MAAIDQLGQAMAMNASQRIALAQSEIERDREGVTRAGHHRLSLAGSKFGDILGHLLRSAEAIRKDAGTQIEFFAQRNVGLGPEATLRWGYATVRDAAGKPLGTKREAETEPVLRIEFQNARRQVENQTAKEPGP